jgi:hypothetical protein
MWTDGGTTAHRKAREFVLVRDGNRCRIRDEVVCTVVATEAHHTLGRGVTGDDPAYMIATCKPCNLRVGDPRVVDPQHVTRNPWWIGQ